MLEGTYAKIPSSLLGEDINDKKGNKMQALHRKNNPNAPGEELYDKNENKLDGGYSQLNPDE